MSRIKQLFKNLRYISKIDLRKKGLIDLSIDDLFTNLLYYIPNSSITRPNILDQTQTVDLLCNSKKSLCRFGDGEISIINGHDIPFQKYDEKLAQRMRDIMKNNNNKLLVGINYWYFYPIYDIKADKTSHFFALYSMPKYRKELIRFINFSTEYCDAGFTGIRAEKNMQNDEFFQKIRLLWDKKQVVLVGCCEAHKSMQYDLFDNASKQDWVYVPNINAFSRYDDILAEIKQYSKKSLIVLMAGPTSKVLAYDLADIGYRALDLGHLAKSYDWYCKQSVCTSDEVERFFAPDV